MLATQVRRMLADRRATRFMDDVVEQWLHVRNIYSHEPDGVRFRGFDPTLRDAMVRETQLFFASQVREDRPIQELLRARLHVPERALGPALWHRRHLRQPSADA